MNQPATCGRRPTTTDNMTESQARRFAERQAADNNRLKMLLRAKTEDELIWRGEAKRARRLESIYQILLWVITVLYVLGLIGLGFIGWVSKL